MSIHRVPSSIAHWADSQNMLEAAVLMARFPARGSNWDPLNLGRTWACVELSISPGQGSGPGSAAVPTANPGRPAAPLTPRLPLSSHFRVPCAVQTPSPKDKLSPGHTGLGFVC